MTPATSRYSDPGGPIASSVWFAGNTLTGLSFGWWVPKHNAHHAHPNQVDRDPDIGAGVVAFTAEIAGRRQRRRSMAGSMAGMVVLPTADIRSGCSPCGGSPDAGWTTRSCRNGRWRTAGRPCGVVPRCPVLAAVPDAGVGIHRRPAGALRPLPGLYLRPQPQGNGPSRPRRTRCLPHRQVVTSRNITGGPMITLCWAVSTTRSSTTSSRRCPAPIWPNPSGSFENSAWRTRCPTRRPTSSTPTVRRSRISAPWELADDRPTRGGVAARAQPDLGPIGIT